MSVDANAAAGVSTWNMEVPFGIKQKLIPITVM